MPPPKQEKNTLALEAKVDNLERKLADMNRETNDKLDRILQFLKSPSEQSLGITTPLQNELVEGPIMAADELSTWARMQAFPPGSSPDWVMMEEAMEMEKEEKMEEGEGDGGVTLRLFRTHL